MTTFEYGVMSSKFSCEAENKLTAYVAMIYHYDRNSHMVVLYEPEDIVKDDIWVSFDGKISKRLDEIFGGEGAFDQYVEDHLKEIKACFNTIKRLV